MNTRDIEAFVAVVETGSLSAASGRLHLTQPGVSRRLRNLEDLLGVALVDRQSKPLKPSAAGLRVYELGRGVLAAVAALRQGAAPDAEPRGEFRVGVPPFLAEPALADPLDVLRGRYPGLSVNVTAAWSPSLVPMVENGALDAAAIMMPDTETLPAHLCALPLARSAVVIVASPSLAIARDAAGVVPLEALARHPWVLNQDGCGLRTAIRKTFEAAGLPFRIAVEAYGAELQLSLAARGVGIGLVTPGALARSRHREALTILNVPAFTTGLRAELIHLPTLGPLAAPVALLRDELLHALGGAPGRI